MFTGFYLLKINFHCCCCHFSSELVNSTLSMILANSYMKRNSVKEENHLNETPAVYHALAPETKNRISF